MTVEVKICGLNDDEALEAAITAGADLVGIVFYGPSPRHVEPDTAARLAARARGRARIVALTVDPSDRDVDGIARIVAPDYIQLHGEETIARVGDIARRSGVEIIKAIKVAEPDDVEKGVRYGEVAARLLFDAKVTRDAPGLLPGGNGIAFDWRLLRDLDPGSGYLLSGGLHPGNVAQAIALTGAPAVDVSSGVERAPGVKDPGLIRDFLRAAKAPGARDRREPAHA